MTARELERLQRKVIAGERLDEAELARLQERATTPKLRLTFAHALMNAEQDRRALELLRSLERDLPHDAEVQAALARALIGVEDFAGAEAALKRALQLRPGDPEVMKSLAALILRHGELAKAKRLVADALERDPFDGEARALKEELEAVDPDTLAGPRPHFTVQAFGDALVTAVKAAGLRYTRRGSELLIGLSEREVARFDLDVLHADAIRRGAPLEEAVALLAEELKSLRGGTPATKAEKLARALPVLRPAAFLEAAHEAMHREATGGLFVFYVYEDPHLVRYIPASEPLALEALDAAAFANLEARPAELVPVSIDSEGRIREVLPEEALPVLAVYGNDGHDAARLLTASQRQRIAAALGEGPWHVHLGQRALAIVAKSAALLTALPVASDGIGGVFRLAPDGTLSPV